MKRFVEGEDRNQATLLPEYLDDFVVEENPVRVIEVFIEELDLASLGFAGVTPAATGRPAYHPSTLLKIYLYGYLNRIEVQPATGAGGWAQHRTDVVHQRPWPDFKTIADFRKDNGEAILVLSADSSSFCLAGKMSLFSQRPLRSSTAASSRG